MFHFFTLKYNVFFILLQIKYDPHFIYASAVSKHEILYRDRYHLTQRDQILPLRMGSLITMRFNNNYRKVNEIRTFLLSHRSRTNGHVIIKVLSSHDRFISLSNKGIYVYIIIPPSV